MKSYITLWGLTLVACSSAAQTPGTKGTGTSLSTPCTGAVAHECPGDQVCAFPTADKCAAKGQCVQGPPGDLPWSCPGHYYCGCGGQIVVTDQCGLPNGYRSMPLAGLADEGASSCDPSTAPPVPPDNGPPPVAIIVEAGSIITIEPDGAATISTRDR